MECKSAYNASDQPLYFLSRSISTETALAQLQFWVRPCLQHQLSACYRKLMYIMSEHMPSAVCPSLLKLSSDHKRKPRFFACSY